MTSTVLLHQPKGSRYLCTHLGTRRGVQIRSKGLLLGCARWSSPRVTQSRAGSPLDLLITLGKSVSDSNGSRLGKASALPQPPQNTTSDKTKHKNMSFARRPKGKRCPICHREGFLGDSLKFHVPVCAKLHRKPIPVLLGQAQLGTSHGPHTRLPSAAIIWGYGPLCF